MDRRELHAGAAGGYRRGVGALREVVEPVEQQFEVGWWKLGELEEHGVDVVPGLVVEQIDVALTGDERRPYGLRQGLERVEACDLAEFVDRDRHIGSSQRQFFQRS